MKKQYQEEKTCACCGKTMYVLHPSRWAYKKKKGKETYTWYCSWKCMRKDETVERRLTQENYDEAVEIAIRGEDPLAYLKKNGAKNPSATWCYIKKKLATSDPDKLAKVPEKVGTVINEKGQAVPVVRPLKKEEHKGIKNEGTSWPPPPGGMYISQDIKITRFETNFGKFSETETGRIQAEVKTATSVTVIILKKEEWIQLMGEIEAAMKIFAGGQ